MKPMLYFLTRSLASLCLLSLLALSLPLSALAVTSNYAARQIMNTGSGTITMAPGETRTISLTLQNSGTSTWVNDGPGYISLYTHGPKYRVSVFDPGTWLSKIQVKRLKESVVKPGETGTLEFALRAPLTPGRYEETFALGAENLAWVTGGQFTLSIIVKSADSAVAPSSVSSAPASYSARVVAQSASRLKLLAGKTVPLSVVLENTGSTAWQKVSLERVPLTIASGTSISFANSTWAGQVAAQVSEDIKPGGQLTIPFYLTAPKINGSHVAKFQFSVNDSLVPGVFLELPVDVTGGAGEVLNSPVINELENKVENLIAEPVIRVGVLIIDEETEHEVYITSYESAFDLYDSAGKVLGSYGAGEKVRAAYTAGQYVYGPENTKSSLPIRFVPKTPNAVMTITNFDRRLTRGAAKAYNTFRNVLEIRYNGTKDRTWVINELPLEFYMRGLAETSNSSPVEFQKALLTAARTYAFYHWTRATKHAAEGYHVDAYRDQVYWGYGQEEQTPKITAGVEATRGQVVTYDGATAVTAYFSRSDGRTRDWSQVWGGNVPWSKSVAVPCDEGKTLWGHGVGMSASGAICLANEGKSWEDILKYFYTGIEITKRWP